MTPDEVKDREDFVRFVRWLQRDLRQHKDQWENTTLELFLGGLAAWTTSMEGYYANLGLETPTPDWHMFAQLLTAGLVYE